MRRVRVERADPTQQSSIVEVTSISAFCNYYPIVKEQRAVSKSLWSQPSRHGPKDKDETKISSGNIFRPDVSSCLPRVHVSYSVSSNFLKWGYVGDYIGDYYRGY